MQKMGRLGVTQVIGNVRSRLMITDCPEWAWSGSRIFYILDLENFATASRQCIGAINKFVDGQLVDYTYDGRASHG